MLFGAQGRLSLCLVVRGAADAHDRWSIGMDTRAIPRLLVVVLWFAVERVVWRSVVAIRSLRLVVIACATIHG